MKERLLALDPSAKVDPLPVETLAGPHRSIEAYCRARAATDEVACEDASGDHKLGADDEPATVALAPPFRGVAVASAGTNRGDSHLGLELPSGWWFLEEALPGWIERRSMDRASVVTEVRAVKRPGKPPLLSVRYEVDESLYDYDDATGTADWGEAPVVRTAYLRLCALAGERPQCTAAITLSQARDDRLRWALDARVNGGKLVLRVKRGSPPTDVVGAYPLPW